MSDHSFTSCTDEVECLPLKTLEEVLMWMPKNVKYDTEPLWERVYIKDVPKTLVCHDMKGGYLEDRFIHGIHKEDCYIFIHWSIVDIFVYFSHHFVTIPPCGWITAAHRNGTKILGTIITEWDEGAKICENFLNSEQSVHHLCTQLTSIAVFYGFDGWLINIENKIQFHQIKQLEEFVSVLSQKMHTAKPDSLVIWYDSVIETGELKWQNSLNQHNRNFFSACDGIFLNYTWKDEHLRTSVTEAGLRIADVYVGVDVFGRGCFGGGGFCTNVAVRAARDYGLSVAIFAPGWVYEFLGKDNFLENQYRFWDMLAELCPPHSVKRLPFSTSFCPGFGKKMHRKGKVISNEPWFDLSLQQPQPTYHYMQSSPLGGSITVFLEDVYNGGGCLEFKGRQKHDNKIQTFGLLSTFFELDKTCIISYTFKPIFPHSVDFTLLLSVSSSENLYNLHLLGEKTNTESEQSEQPNDHINIHAGASSLEKLKYPAALTDLEAIANRNFNFSSLESGWITRVYIIPASEFRNHIIKSVDSRITYQCEEANSHFSVLLGQLQILPLEDRIHLYYRDLQQQIKGNKIYLWCRLEWTRSKSLPVQNWDIFYNYCGKQSYLWTTSQTFFKVNKLDLDVQQSDGKSEIEFILSAQNIHGQPVESESITICL